MKKVWIKFIGILSTCFVMPFSSKDLYGAEAYCTVDRNTMSCGDSPDTIGESCGGGVMDFCHSSRYEDCNCYECSTMSECSNPICRSSSGNFQCRIQFGVPYGTSCSSSWDKSILSFCHESRRDYNTCTCRGCTSFSQCATATGAGSGDCVAFYSDDYHHVKFYNVCGLSMDDGDYYSWQSVSRMECFTGYYGQYSGGFDHCEKCPEGGTTISGAPTGRLEGLSITDCFKVDQVGSNASGRFIIPGVCFYS